ncbi:MAG: excinuclease ABC subunit C [Candidatus Buchananbacteria bacterium CG10_big_fil_rev_8_21_14_0_10_42_9]|uniref:UvrABC system protein C n=1 Tax=Candidatus Buchananbacteria bacterium CG10_big_fil_rev_8_21_14_0_10_42_9 TaxID=1974526 RepID=A0A2H0W1K3_9BACT|nr:MAG: excinuclease ABC subunit C [Candidatus Buchananbacteria bacterium CG10_big_fil_rev_8_21_14_0_10_42_9]
MPKLKTQLTNLPHQPGCYLYYNSAGKLLYIGKAKDIKKRVASYFTKNIHDPKTEKLISEIAKVDYIVTDNELEAYLLENKLIKKRQPVYNIMLKDDKTYAYIEITKEKFPRLVTTRTKSPDKKLFGPYPSGYSRQHVLRLANSLFKLRVCKKLPKRPCLLYHINQCSAPCINNISEGEYVRNVTLAEMLLKGDIKPLTKKLEFEMDKFSKRQEYEIAKLKRDQMRALQSLATQQRVDLKKRYDQNVINYVATAKQTIFGVFRINKGVITGKQEFVFKKELALLEDFITRYYETHDIPEEIIIPERFENQKLVAAYLTKAKGKKVSFTVPQRGDKVKLLDLVKTNILTKEKEEESALFELRQKLKLENVPRTIECFDISNLGETNKVGSMVYFKDGKPDKSNYRRFKIRTVEGQSDYDSMREVVLRRYLRLVKENKTLPDLVIVDGGKPQMSAALSAFREIGIQLPLIGLAKKHEEVYTTYTQYPFRFSRRTDALKLLQHIRDEAHRFAITYHRVLRSKGMR